MNAKEFAEMLNDREYRDEIDKREERLAEENGLVVIFGASDDLMEIRGYIYEEIDCYGGGYVRFKDRDILHNPCPAGDDCGNFSEIAEGCKKVEAKWNAEGYSWIYETSIPHETFDILEDGEKYCRGIVFSIDDI